MPRRRRKTRRTRRKRRRKTRSKRRYRRGGRITELPENRPHHDGALDQIWNRLRRLIEVVNRCHPNECRDAQAEMPEAVPVNQEEARREIATNLRARGRSEAEIARVTRLAGPGRARGIAAGDANIPTARAIGAANDGPALRRTGAGSPTLAAANHARLAAANHARWERRRLDEARQEARAAAAHDPRDGGGAANDGDDAADDAANDGGGGGGGEWTCPNCTLLNDANAARCRVCGGGPGGGYHAPPDGGGGEGAATVRRNYRYYALQAIRNQRAVVAGPMRRLPMIGKRNMDILRFMEALYREGTWALTKQELAAVPPRTRGQRDERLRDVAWRRLRGH